MMRHLGRVRLKELGLPYMVTLTYPQDWPEDRAVAGHLKVFQQRARRRGFYAHGFWRVELQKRGAPHFHIIVWSDGEGFPTVAMVKAQLAWIWSEIVGTDDRHHRAYGVKVTAGKETRKAISYLCKYVSKGDARQDTTYRGRRWGHTRQLPMGAKYEQVFDADERHLEVAFRRYLRRWLRSGGRRGTWRVARLIAQGKRTEVFISEEAESALFWAAMRAPPVWRAGPGDELGRHELIRLRAQNDRLWYAQMANLPVRTAA